MEGKVEKEVVLDLRFAMVECSPSWGECLYSCSSHDYSINSLIF